MTDENDIRQSLLDSFGRFVPQDFLQLLGISDFSQIQLGDQIENKLTILFSDIRGFTTLSENLGAKGTFDYLNRYLNRMVKVIRKHHGFVDKYIGDAILALFPGGNNDAIQASLEMLVNLKKFNQEWEAEGHPKTEIGIGLNTGIVILGTIGDKQRMETTVIGDSVNLASRLESLCKIYQTPLLISEHSLNGLDESLRPSTRFVDRIRVKGKFRPESVYEVFAHQSEELIQAKQNSREIFEKAIAYYHLKAIDQAQKLFEDCLQICPEDEIVSYYLKRCQAWFESGHFEGTGELELNLQWKNEYLLGIPLVDQQHQQLLTRTSRLLKSIHQDQATDWEEVLNFLGEYIALHFQTEEDLLEKYHYPFLDAHRYEHRCFTENYFNLKNEIKFGHHDRLYLLFKIDLFLVDWLINHTTKNDRHWATYIRQAGYPHTD